MRFNKMQHTENKLTTIKFQKSKKNIWKWLENCITFATLLARIAQLVEHDLAKVGVASSSLVSRSFFLRSFEVEISALVAE